MLFRDLSQKIKTLQKMRSNSLVCLIHLSITITKHLSTTISKPGYTYNWRVYFQRGHRELIPAKYPQGEVAKSRRGLKIIF